MPGPDTTVTPRRSRHHRSAFTHRAQVRSLNTRAGPHEDKNILPLSFRHPSSL